MIHITEFSHKRAKNVLITLRLRRISEDEALHVRGSDERSNNNRDFDYT